VKHGIINILDKYSIPEINRKKYSHFIPQIDCFVVMAPVLVGCVASTSAEYAASMLAAPIPIPAVALPPH
jgi:hypothetical protein